MGQTFKKGELFKPEEPEEKAGAGEDADADLDNFNVSFDFFVERMIGIGYQGMDDIVDTFKFLDHNHTKHLNKGKFLELERMGAPASVEKMVKLRRILMDKFGNLREAFDKFDLDKNQEVSKEEWGRGLKRMKIYRPHKGPITSPAVIQEFFTALDVSNSGKLDFQEFTGVHLYATLAAFQQWEALTSWLKKKFKKNVFRQLDVNNSGSLS